ncbi:MAG: hypothetical protein AB7O13_19115 [Alphaproteobacteria bacterium]
MRLCLAIPDGIHAVAAAPPGAVPGTIPGTVIDRGGLATVDPA